jgi:hypothetical protein
MLAPSPEGSVSDADRRARHDLIEERFFIIQAGDVLRRARELEPRARYESLAKWVLPDAAHAIFRMQGDFTPTNPAGPGDTDPQETIPAGKSRVLIGGKIVAPALALVDAAAAASKLDELAERVKNLETKDDFARRSQLALLVLIGIARNDDAAAVASLSALKPLLEKLSLDGPEWTRWPELIATARAIHRPTLREQALALLDVMTDQTQKKSPRGQWDHHVRNIRARGRLLASGGGNTPFGDDLHGAPWAGVTHFRAETRGFGEPIPAWTLRDGQFTHQPGHAHDILYFGVPLQGDFQFECELTLPKVGEIQAGYGGLAIAPTADLKRLQRMHYGRTLGESALNLPADETSGWYPYKMVVHGGTMTSFINGRPVLTDSIHSETDPWISFFCSVPFEGSARAIRISGHPTIPDRLNLSAGSDLTGWIAEEYVETVAGDNPDWSKRGAEIIGRRKDEFPGSKQESLLRYNRPMLEDGEISYEFFHEPDKSMTHPAVDRLAFLIEPDGVKLHRLTDAQYERGGLAAGNAAIESDCRRGPASLPLKVREWNKMAVSLAGDRISLRLNGELIYERTLEPTNQRGFGLFHFADETEARVRSVSYEGAWPKSLPASVVGPSSPPR